MFSVGTKKVLVNLEELVITKHSGGASGKEPAFRCRRLKPMPGSLGWKDPLEEGMATHSSILAWRIPRTEEPSGLQSKGSQESTESNLARTHVSAFTLLCNSHHHPVPDFFTFLN